MAQTHHERELKFDVPVGFRMPPLMADGVAAAPQRSVELRSTYFDTPAHDLLGAGLTLRRREGDEDTGWHLKVPAGDARTEVQLPLDGTETVPSELAELVSGVAHGQDLAPVAIVRTHRQVTSVRGPSGEVAAEVADDLVTGTALGAGATVSEWREVEVELAAGSEDLLQAIADRLTDAGARPSASASKLARALNGEMGRHRPVHGQRGALMLQGYLEQQARALVAGDVALRRGEDPIHPTRVAVRRTRSLLRVFADLLDERATAFDAELSWYQQLLGEVRDREVQRGHFAQALDALPPELVLGPVRTRIDQSLAAEQRDARTELGEAMSGDRYRAVLATVLGWAADPPLRPGADVSRRAVRSRVRAAQKKAGNRLRRALAADDPVLLHRARKAAKRARYGCEVLALAGDPKAAARVERYKSLQDALGAHQDAVLSAAILRRLGAAAGTTPGENGFTYGLLYERELGAAAAARRAAAGLAR